MATNIIKRAVKGSALIHAEMDQNLESMSMTVDAVTANYTLQLSDQNKLMELNGTNITLSMMPAATAAAAQTDSFHVWVKNINATPATVDGDGVETIDGAVNISLVENEAVLLSLSSSGAEWAILAHYNNGILSFSGVAADLAILAGGAAAGVTSTEFQYLNGVTSTIQTQLDARLFASNNLSDVANASTSRTNLGLAIGADVQAFDAQLADIAGLTPTDNGVVIGDGTNLVIESGATLRISMGLAIGSDVQAYDALLDDISGLTPSDSGFVVGDGANFIVESGVAARASLGLLALSLLDTVSSTEIDDNSIGNNKLVASDTLVTSSSSLGSGTNVVITAVGLLHISIDVGGSTNTGVRIQNLQNGVWQTLYDVTPSTESGGMVYSTGSNIRLSAGSLNNPAPYGITRMSDT